MRVIVDARGVREVRVVPAAASEGDDGDTGLVGRLHVVRRIPEHHRLFRRAAGGAERGDEDIRVRLRFFGVTRGHGVIDQIVETRLPQEIVQIPPGARGRDDELRARCFHLLEELARLRERTELGQMSS